VFDGFDDAVLITRSTSGSVTGFFYNNIFVNNEVCFAYGSTNELYTKDDTNVFNNAYLAVNSTFFGGTMGIGDNASLPDWPGIALPSSPFEEGTYQLSSSPSGGMCKNVGAPVKHAHKNSENRLDLGPLQAVIVEDYPDPSDVRSGVVYDNGVLVGTCKVPPVNHVRKNIPVDHSYGTCYVPAPEVVKLNVPVDHTVGTLDARRDITFMDKTNAD